MIDLAVAENLSNEGWAAITLQSLEEIRFRPLMGPSQIVDAPMIG